MVMLPETLQALGLPAQWLVLFAAVCGVVAAVMPWLPAPTGGGVYAVIYGILNKLAQNYGNAKNADGAAASTTPTTTAQG